MYEWKIVKSSRVDLEFNLNSFEKAGWEVFGIVSFVNTKVVMVNVPLPQDVEYDIILRKQKETGDIEGAPI